MSTKSESTHNAGAERHPDVWLAANMRACEAAASRGIVPHSEIGREVIPCIVLRLLDGLKIEQGMTWDKDAKAWKPREVAIPA